LESSVEYSKQFFWVTFQGKASGEDFVAFSSPCDSKLYSLIESLTTGVFTVDEDDKMRNG
jgi:hypothetical protein